MGPSVDWNWQRNESLSLRKTTTETPKIGKQKEQRLKKKKNNRRSKACGTITKGVAYTQW